LGNAGHLAATLQAEARADTLPLYGRVRAVMAVERRVMLKTLRCQVRVVWVFRKTQWVALVTTDLCLTVEQIIEYYGARWKIEAGFREIKQEIGSAETQTRHPDAVTNHLHFCMAATTITWIYGAHLAPGPAAALCHGQADRIGLCRSAPRTRQGPRWPGFRYRLPHPATAREIR
jgi:hypothetical protein